MAVDPQKQARISVEEANAAISQLRNDKPVLRARDPPQNDHAGLLQRELDKLAIERKQWEASHGPGHLFDRGVFGFAAHKQESDDSGSTAATTKSPPHSIEIPRPDLEELESLAGSSTSFGARFAIPGLPPLPAFHSPFAHPPFQSHGSPSQRRASYSYESSSTASDSEIPLSMRFMHKPSRAKEMLEKQDDPTRRNSLLNAQIGYVDKAKFITNSHPQLVAEDSDSTDKESIKSPGSPPITHTLVRKKSGEIVKSSLKESSEPSYFDKKKRSRSLPTTPTYKQVHFGGDNDVKYFHRRDRPLAISALNSPTLGPSDHMVPGFSDDERESDELLSDNYDDDGYEETDEEGDEYFKNLRKKSPVLNTTYPNPHHEHLIDWSLELMNFPPMVYEKKIGVNAPVFLERIFISPDKKYLLGHIAVKNLSFQKYITVRYTLDSWQTIIEIPTKYNPDGPQVLKAHNYDRFLFRIPLENLFNSFRMNNNSFESPDDVMKHSQVKTYNLCVKYNTNCEEFWDNNEARNYEIKLTKIIKSHGQSFKANGTSSKSSQAPKPQDTKHIQAHQKKPRYSNSYLKRKSHSDTQLTSLARSYLASPTPAEPTEEFILRTPADIKEEEESKKKLAKEFGLASKSEEKSSPLKEMEVPKLFKHDNSSSDVNDFVKNDFYLSSPMLSSYNDNALDYSSDLIEPGSLSTLKMKFKTPDLYRPITSSNGTAESTEKTTFELPPKKTEFSPMEKSELDEARLSFLNKAQAAPAVNNYIHNRNLYNTQSYKELLDNYCFYNPSQNTDMSGEYEFQPPLVSDFKLPKAESLLKATNENTAPGSSEKKDGSTVGTSKTGKGTKTISSILGGNK